MSKALKCDRCGEFYERTKVQTGGYFVTRYSTGGYPLDLCPVCREEFKHWFDEKKKDEDESFFNMEARVENIKKMITFCDVCGNKKEDGTCDKSAYCSGIPGLGVPTCFVSKDKKESIDCISCKHVGLRFSKYEPCASCRPVKSGREGDLVGSNYERKEEVKKDE